MPNRRFVILKSDTNANGIAEIETYRRRLRIGIRVKNDVPLGEHEVFKAYLLTDREKNLFERLGTLKDGQGIFDVPEIPVCGIYIYRKNAESGVTALEFWGSGGDNETEVQNKGKKEARIMEIAKETENEELCVARVASPEDCLAGEWQKINGYYSVYRYDIVRYILELPQVREKISRYGYYLTCKNERENETLIALAFPAQADDVIPFGERSDFAVRIQKTPSERDCYFAVTVGVDEKGEFFRKPER